MELVFATNNKHKITELKSVIKDIYGDKINILTLSDVGFSGDIVEDGETFSDNAYIKASTVCRFCGKPTVADDSGLAVDALNGAPGVMSARYSGADCDDIRNIIKLLDELKTVPEKRRTAKFVCHICCVFPDGKRLDAEGYSEGKILYECRGDGDFGYDPVFYNEEYEMTFAEMDMQTKNKVSHRGAALREFAKILSGVDVDIMH